MFAHGLFSLINLVVQVVTLATKGWALADAARRPGTSYPTSRLDKKLWLLILGLGLAAQAVYVLAYGITSSTWMGILPIAGLIAALYYLYGVKPKMVTRRSSSDGPYGPW